MRTSKLILLFALATSYSLSLIADTPPQKLLPETPRPPQRPLPQTPTQRPLPQTPTADQLKKAKAAKAAYDSLIKAPSYFASKKEVNQKVADLETLGAMIVNKTLNRIISVTDMVLGKSSKESKELHILAKTTMSGTNSMIPATPIPQIWNALDWAEGKYDKANETFFVTRELTNTLLEERHKEKVVIEVRLNAEIGAFDLRYKPVIKELKKLKKNTVLPDSLEGFKVLYKNAFHP